MLKNILYCLVSTLSLNVLFSIDVTPYVKYHYSSDTELYAIEKQNLSYRYYDSKEKLELKIHDKKIYFSPNQLIQQLILQKILKPKLYRILIYLF